MITFRTAAQRVASAAAVSALVITALAGAATAEIEGFQDARGDVSQGADIEMVRVVNGDERVKVKVFHRDLVRSYKSGSSLAVYIDTNRERTGPEYVFQGATFEGGDYALLKAKGFAAAGSRQVPLNGGTYLMRLDYAEDVATIKIDRVVLRSPGRIRVEVKTGAELLPAGNEEPSNAKDWLGTPESFTSWVKRG